MSKYVYYLDTHFVDGVNIDKLNREIEDTLSKSFVLMPIGNKIRIYFMENLTTEEEGDLIAVISSHDGNSQLDGRDVLNVNITSQSIRNSTYLTVSTFTFPGLRTISPTSINIVSRMDEGGDSYDLRLVDITNNKTIGTVNLANTGYAINNISSIYNLPKNNSIFDLQCKVNGNTTAYVKNLSIYYY